MKSFTLDTYSTIHEFLSETEIFLELGWSDFEEKSYTFYVVPNSYSTPILIFQVLINFAFFLGCRASLSAQFFKPVLSMRHGGKYSLIFEKAKNEKKI